MNNFKIYLCTNWLFVWSRRCSWDTKTATRLQMTAPDLRVQSNTLKDTRKLLLMPQKPLTFQIDNKCRLFSMSLCGLSNFPLAFRSITNRKRLKSFTSNMIWDTRQLQFFIYQGRNWGCSYLIISLFLCSARVSKNVSVHAGHLSFFFFKQSRH